VAAAAVSKLCNEKRQPHQLKIIFGGEVVAAKNSNHNNNVAVASESISGGIAASKKLKKTQLNGEAWKLYLSMAKAGWKSGEAKKLLQPSRRSGPEMKSAAKIRKLFYRSMATFYIWVMKWRLINGNDGKWKWKLRLIEEEVAAKHYRRRDSMYYHGWRRKSWKKQWRKWK